MSRATVFVFALFAVVLLLGGCKSKMSFTNQPLTFHYPGSEKFVGLLWWPEGIKGRSRSIDDPRIKIVSTNNEVVRADGRGIVAVGAGQAEIVARLGFYTARLPVTVMQPIRGDFDNDGKVTKWDVAHLLTWMRATSEEDAKTIRMPVESFDSRDLNKDNVLDYEDIQVLQDLIRKTGP